MLRATTTSYTATNDPAKLTLLNDDHNQLDATTTMTRLKLDRIANTDSIRLPFDETDCCDSSSTPSKKSQKQPMNNNRSSNPVDDDDNSAHVSTAVTLDDSLAEQTLADRESLHKVQDEFLSFVKSQDSISQLSFTVNDSARGEHFDKVYEMGDVLGEGGFAFVYQCFHKRNHHTYAVKEVIKKKEQEGSEGQRNYANGDEIREEIAALRLVKESPHFVRLLDVFDEPTTTFLIMEEMKGGDLLDKLGEIEVYEEWEARKVARTLLEAVHYCHRRKICHRDIKPENILLPRADDLTQIKLADFGCARQWIKPNEMQTLCGSPQYVAPEVVGDSRPEGQGYNCQCDLWSVGVVLYIMLGGKCITVGKKESPCMPLFF